MLAVLLLFSENDVVVEVVVLIWTGKAAPTDCEWWIDDAAEDKCVDEVSSSSLIWVMACSTGGKNVHRIFFSRIWSLASLSTVSHYNRVRVKAKMGYKCALHQIVKKSVSFFVFAYQVCSRELSTLSCDGNALDQKLVLALEVCWRILFHRLHLDYWKRRPWKIYV